MGRVFQHSPRDTGWWGAFGHVDINSDYSNNYILKSGTGYVIYTKATYTINDIYAWGNKEGTPLPLGSIDWAKDSVMSMIGKVSIPHDWEESLRDAGLANEYGFTVSWVENMRIEVNGDFTRFSLPGNGIHDVVLEK